MGSIRSNSVEKRQVMANRSNSKFFFGETHGHTAWNKASNNASRALPVVDKEVEGLEEEITKKASVHASRTLPVVDEKVEGSKKELGSCKKKTPKGCLKELKYNQHCPTCRFRATQQKDAFHVLLAEDKKGNSIHKVEMSNKGHLRAGNAVKSVNA